MTNILYNLLLWLALPGILVYHCYRSITRGRAAALPERFGFIDRKILEPLGGREVIWVHAVSVGETIAVTPLLAALKKEWPERSIVLSNTTETGREVAKKIPHVDLCIHFPFDYAFAVRRLLRLVRPSLVIVMETEIWPNFLRCSRRQGMPVVMVNGRISDRSARGYQRFGWFFRPVLADVAALCMQTEEDARRIISIGAESARVKVTGNLKYDIPAGGLSERERLELRASYGIPADALVFTAGSTHAGEEEIAIAAFKAAAVEQRNLVLVLAPRHPERAGGAAELLQRSGIACRTCTANRGETASIASGGALLVDTVGELKKLYSLSDVVFVGGSLVPTGGHNVLEPAAFGLPVLFGPHMANFREIAAAILRSGAAVQVADGEELATQLRLLCSSPERRSEMGGRGLRWLAGSSGSVERHMAVIRRAWPSSSR